eukprot:scaffold23253_cov69-Phaeocystis_antarctica.AAC.2
MSSVSSHAASLLSVSIPPLSCLHGQRRWHGQRRCNRRLSRRLARAPEAVPGRPASPRGSAR